MFDLAARLIPAWIFDPIAHLIERRFFGWLHDATCPCTASV